MATRPLQYILVKNSNQPFQHVWLQKSDDGARLIHSLENLSVLNFITRNDANIKPGGATVVSVLSARGHLKDLKAGQLVNGLVHEKGLGNEMAARNALLYMYAKSGRLDSAHKIVNGIHVKD